MVHAASAVAFAVVAFNVASTMANPIYDNSNELVEREFTDFDVDAREFDEFDAREFDEFEARDLFEQLSELDTRDYDEVDAREYEEVYNYLRDVSSSVTATASATSTASSALKTITKTSTIVPKPTSCTKSELKAKKQAKKLAHKKAKQAKKAKKLLEKKAKKNAKKQAKKAKKAAKKAKKAAKKEAKKAKKGKHSPTTSTSSTSVTSTSVTSTSVTSTPVTSFSSIRPTASVTGAFRVAAAHITAAPNAKAAVHANLSRATITGKHGTVTVRVTTTAAQPACTRASKFKKLFKHKEARDVEEVDDLFAREYDFDELD